MGLGIFFTEKNKDEKDRNWYFPLSSKFEDIELALFLVPFLAHEGLNFAVHRRECVTWEDEFVFSQVTAKGESCFNLNL